MEAKKKVYEYKEKGVLYGSKRLYRVRLMHVFIQTDRISTMQVLSRALKMPLFIINSITQSITQHYFPFKKRSG